MGRWFEEDFAAGCDLPGCAYNDYDDDLDRMDRLAAMTGLELMEPYLNGQRSDKYGFSGFD